MCTFWNQVLWSNKFGPGYSKWLVSKLTIQNIRLSENQHYFVHNLLLCNIERYIKLLHSLSLIRWNSKTSSLGFLVAVVTKDFSKLANIFDPLPFRLP